MDGGKSICLTANNEIELFDFEWEKTPQVIGPTINFLNLLQFLQQLEQALKQKVQQW